MHPALRHTAHRPWPLARGPWLGRQVWADLAFLHWRIPASTLRPLVPAPLQIQEFDGSSWVGVVPFRMEGVMARGLPDLPGVSAFPELNVRLYVEHEGKPGVWFLSLDADNALAVWGARRFFHLPYHRARMRLSLRGDAIEYESVRRGAEQVCFRGSYRPSGDVYAAAPGGLDHWLTERYCLYALGPDRRLRRTEVHHAQWPLSSAQVTITQNGMLLPHGVPLQGAPLCHFARRIDVIVWAPELCS